MALDSVKVYYGAGNVEADSALALSEADRNMLQEAYTATMQADFSGTQHIDAFTPAVSALLNNRAGIGWNSKAHTAVPVQVFAIGQGAEAFMGFYDNTDIANKIMQIAKLKRPAR